MIKLTKGEIVLYSKWEIKTIEKLNKLEVEKKAPNSASEKIFQANLIMILLNHNSKMGDLYRKSPDEIIDYFYKNLKYAVEHREKINFFEKIEKDFRLTYKDESEKTFVENLCQRVVDDASIVKVKEKILMPKKKDEEMQR